MLNLKQCWWPEVSTWQPFTCSQSSHLRASLLCLFFPTASSEQSLAVPLPFQLLPSLSSMLRKFLLQHLGASLLFMTLTQDMGVQHILWSTQLCLSGGAVECGTCGAALWKRVGIYLIAARCSTGTMLICFPQCHGFFGECDLIENYAVLHFGQVEGFDFRRDTLLQEWTRWFYSFLSRVG